MSGWETEVRHCGQQHRSTQGTVLSPVLFTLYTSDFQYKSEFCHVQKFWTDVFTAIVGCIRSGQEDEYRELIKDFVTWCDLNHLLLNTTKTREMVVDFRRPRPHPEPVIIKGDCVEVVHTYKYLGVQLDDKLDWTANTDALCRKGQRPPVLPQKAGVLQHLQEAAADLLPVCGSERPPVRSSVLGGSLKKKDAAAPGQTGEEGRLCRWHRAGQPDICGRATDAEQAPVHHRQSKSSTAQRHLQAEEQLQ
ncbi:hypothetical protein L3Q82_005882 [Scortum barcoo]|uniref:Uncharacterized protein n=1 Tax=Scortum barcoo TaxID=214431 RepID=A0ACB8V6R2_9TELE|nr:hypothetical protein L3Q82_005882 [Scortum barcoo]